MRKRDVQALDVRAGYSDLVMMMLEKGKENLVTILSVIAASITITDHLWGGGGGEGEKGWIKMIFDLFPEKIDTFWLIITILAMVILLANFDKIPLLGRKYKEYEEEAKQLKPELEEKTRQYNELVEKSESMLDRKIQLTDCEIISDDSLNNPKISIAQNFANMTELYLKLNKVEISIKADGAEFEKIVYNPPGHTIELGDKIKTPSESFSPLTLNRQIIFETRGFGQAIHEYHGKEIEITVDGIIEFAAGDKKIEKTIKGSKKIQFRFKPHLTIS